MPWITRPAVTTALFSISGSPSSSPSLRSPAVTAAMPESCAAPAASSSLSSTIGASNCSTPVPVVILYEILEARYGRRSTILTSQIPVGKWHPFIGDPTYADAVVDRLVHNAHRIDLAGDSLRRRRPRSTQKD